MECIICHSPNMTKLFERDLQLFYRCPSCGLILRDPASRLDEGKERERYLLHDNTPSNTGYLAYLNRFIEEQIIENISIDDPLILDFGSGPEPVLSDLLKERGYRVSSYDTYFSPDRGYAKNSYDLIVLLEVIEHIADPLAVCEGLSGLLNPGGRMILQTMLVDEKIRDTFGSWWYKEDMTHISFYTKESFEILAQQLGLTVVSSGKNVTIFLKEG